MEDSYRDVIDAKTPQEYLRAEVAHLRSLDDTSGDAEMMEKAADEIEQLRKDTVLLVSGLAWAVGALEGTGHSEGHAKNTLEQFLGRAISSVKEAGDG